MNLLKAESAKTVIVIPVYKEVITALEQISLSQCLKLFSNKYPICCIKPEFLDISKIIQEFPFDDVVSFDNTYFTDIQGYNRLMLSPVFYEKFINYEFMLLHQLDAFVFRNDLEYWCSKNFDYIGAPWLRPNDYPDIVKKIKCKIMTPYHIKVNKRKDGIPTEQQFENKVGNGGFSLRRVRKFFDLTISHKSLIDFYNAQTHHHFHEDAFWSIEVNRKRNHLKIPSYKIAAQFAFENTPERCLKLTKGSLPFGCHAWDKHLAFWRPMLKECNYTI